MGTGRESSILCFRRHLETAASACRVRHGELLRTRAVNDFLMDAEGNDDSPHDLASFALDYLIAGDKGPMDQTVCIAAIGFLNEQCVDPPEGDQHLKDLAKLVGESATRAQYKLWATAWYP